MAGTLMQVEREKNARKNYERKPDGRRPRKKWNNEVEEDLVKILRARTHNRKEERAIKELIAR